MQVMSFTKLCVCVCVCVCMCVCVCVCVCVYVCVCMYTGHEFHPAAEQLRDNVIAGSDEDLDAPLTPGTAVCMLP